MQTFQLRQKTQHRGDAAVGLYEAEGSCRRATVSALPKSLSEERCSSRTVTAPLGSRCPDSLTAHGRDAGSAPRPERGTGRMREGCGIAPIASPRRASPSEPRPWMCCREAAFGCSELQAAGDASSESGLQSPERRGKETNVARSRWRAVLAWWKSSLCSLPKTGDLPEDSLLSSFLYALILELMERRRW